MLELADAGDLSRMIKVSVNLKKIKARSVQLPWIVILFAQHWVKCSENVRNRGEKWSV